MSNLSEFVKRHLEQHAQSVERKQAGESDVFLFSSGGKNTAMNCCIRVSEQTRGLCVTVSNGIKAPRRRMPQAYELVCRLNAGMAIGQYWVDSEDGEISFTVTANLLEMAPTERWFGSLIFTAVCTFDKFFPVVSTVLYGKKTPKSALAAHLEPSDKEVANSLKRLFSASQSEAQPPQRAAHFGEAKGDSAAGDGRKRRTKPEVSLKITPGEIQDVLNEQREQRRRQTRKGKGDDAE